MRNYYLVGANRGVGEDEWKSVFADMVKASAVDVGYSPGIDLSFWYGKPADEIYKFLKKADPDHRSANSHKLFLNLRPGDAVAVKKFAAPIKKVPRLVICGYGVVKARPSGQVYRYRKGHVLPHQISVDFHHIADHQFQIGGFRTTISQLTKPEYIEKIFAPLFGRLSASDRADLMDRAETARREGTLKNVADLSYHLEKNVKATQKHNRLQNQLYQQLLAKHGSKCVSLESNWIDIKVDTGAHVTLYEVKPFDSALLCLRAALGQILHYAWKQGELKGVEVRLVIAGPSELTGDGKEFLLYLRERFAGSLKYLKIP